MLNRRLITLFILFTLGFLALGLRLAKLQLADASHWQEQMQNATRRTYSIDTARGAILDRNGQVLAKDVPCDDLAIDYRAMNGDDQWLSSMALKRIASEKFDNAADKRRRRDEMKKIIADQVDTIPEAIAQVCRIPKEDILARYEDIRQRIHLLHQDLWFRKYDRQNPAATDADDDKDSSADDQPLDLTYRKEDLTDERRAHTIVHNLPPLIANYFRQHADDFPGLIVRDDANLRVYPNGEIASQVIGTLRTINGDEIARDIDENPDEKVPKFKLPDFDGDPGDLSGYQPGDSIGESGAEKILDPYLHGTQGAGLHIVGNGNTGDSDQRIEPIPGKDVRLTLDIALQRDIHNALKDPNKHLLWGTNTATDQTEHKDHFVALVVLRIADGQILTMLSWPNFDPNTIDQTRVALNHDDFRRPLANRALDSYQPGSTVKPLLATAGLTEGVITPETTITCNGYLFPDRPKAFRCSIYVETNGRATHGPLQLEDAIAQSCNIYFYTLGGRLGIDKITNWFRAYGIDQYSGFELESKDHPRGLLPTLTDPRDANEDRTESLFLGIGQGNVGATPLQMANAYATLLRGGLAISPRLVIGNPPTQEQRFRLDPSIVATVRGGMEAVVSRGTAKEIFRGMHLPIAGKTGTADTSRPMFDEATGQPVYDTNRPILDPDGHPRLDPDGKPLYHRASQTGTDAWFVAYAPADNPQYVVAAVMEFGGFGGKAAAPMVKEALLQMERHGYLEKMDVDQ